MSQDLKKIHVKKNTNVRIHKRFLERFKYCLLQILKEHKDLTKILTQQQKIKTFRKCLGIKYNKLPVLCQNRVKQCSMI